MTEIVPDPEPILTGTDAPPPERLTLSHIAEDLTLSNEEGTSWFNYEFEPSDGETYPDLLIANLYNEVGEIVKKFAVTMKIEEISL